MAILADILSSRVRAEIFRLLFGPGAQKLHMRELERQSGCVIGTIQTELKKLLRLGLVRRERDGNRLYYQANIDHPLYSDIRSMVTKTSGPAVLLKQALEGEQSVQVAFIFGSFARGEEQAGSDVDLMVIGSVGLRRVTELLSGLSGQIGREVNPHVMDNSEFSQRRAAGEHFVMELLASEKIFVKGGRDDFEKLG